MSKSIHVPSYCRHKRSGQAVLTLPDGLGGRRDILLGKHGTKNELIVMYGSHAEQHYRRPDGIPTKELSDIRLSCRPLKELYSHTPAKEFGPLA